MYYRIRDYNQLCGFRGLPFAFFNGTNGKTSFFDRKGYALLLDCDGETDIDPNALTKEQKDFLEGAKKDNLIDEMDSPKALSDFAKYHDYDNPFKEEVHWSITGDCNYRCKHCFMSAPDAKFGIPTTEQILDIIEQMANVGVRKVGITGGEPLIRKDFFQIVDSLIEHRINITTVYSNGALVNNELLDGFEKRRVHPGFQISFDGVGWHDWIRGIPGAEKMAIDAIKLLKARGFNVGTTMVVHKKNKDTILESALTLAKAGAQSLKLGKAEDLGCWNKEEALTLNDDEIQEVYLDFIDQYMNAGMPLDLQEAGSFIYSREENKAFIPEDKAGNIINTDDPLYYYRSTLCGCIKKGMYIGPDGRVMPCMSMIGMPIGDKYPSVFDRPLKDILNDSTYHDDAVCCVKDLMEHNPKCAQCKYADKCRGGCRATALDKGSLDYLGPDSSACAFYLNGWYDKFQAKVDEINKNR